MVTDVWQKADIRQKRERYPEESSRIQREDSLVFLKQEAILVELEEGIQEMWRNKWALTI